MTLENQTTESVKGRLDRVFAIILAALSVIALFLPYTVIQWKDSANGYVAENFKFFLFLNLGGKMSGVGLVIFIASILYLLTAVASATLNIIGIFNEDNTATLSRIGSLVLSAGAGIYTLAIITISTYLEHTVKEAKIATSFDIVSLVVAAISVGFFIFFAIQMHKREMLKPLAKYGAALLSTILLALGVGIAGKTANIIIVAVLALVILSLVGAQLCVMYKLPSALLERIRLIAHAAIALILCVLCLLFLGDIKAFLLSFLGVVVAAVFVAEDFLNTKLDNEDVEIPTEGYVYTDYSENGEEEFDENEPELEMFPSIPRAKMVTQEEPFEFEQIDGEPIPEAMMGRPEAAPSPYSAQEPAPATAQFDPELGYHVEEYAEAYAYEGGPVAGVEMAEEVNPTFIPRGQVSTAGYDFYNCQSFDPFIASLNNEERNQFTEIFILKYKGIMPEIPDYVVGGDNREFFRKIFIYLGQYRERIPSELLNKIYAFSTKLS